MAKQGVLLLFLFIAVCVDQTRSKQPNILLILADDLGWNDVGFNNPDMITPNLDCLAREGVILNQSYVQPVCSPSRSALMSGRYPFKIGRQHGHIRGLQPTCLKRDLVTMPDILRRLGYRTHMVGKWHLGFCNKDCTPLRRGFDGFFGKYLGSGDHYYHTKDGGFDLRRNDTVATEKTGIYSTTLFANQANRIMRDHDKSKPLFLYLAFQAPHTPLQVPKEYEDMYKIKNTARRLFCGMVTAMDYAIGSVVTSMKKHNLYDNSIIIFSSDNGANTASGNNYPLRGTKGTVWEGGTRTPTFVHSPLLQKTGYRYDGLFHITDWFPTLASAGGISHEDLPSGLDGVDQWSAIQTGQPSDRQEFVYNMNNRNLLRPQAAIRIGDYKLIRGYPGPHGDGDWVKPPQQAKDTTVEGDSTSGNDPADDLSKARLYNIRDDATEHHDLSKKLPEVVQRLTARLQEHARDLVPADYPREDPSGHPIFWGGAWSPGWC